ncbi:hypothetical protein FRC07_004819 [Ceratobasidium sp. 392]|nr:hypothetical protein FRC07_004819 [Ceratobasidium sp. 392]
MLGLFAPQPLEIFVLTDRTYSLWDAPEKDIFSSSMSRVLMHNDNPNSSLGCYLDAPPPLTLSLDRPYSTPTAPTPPAQPIYDNQLLNLDRQFPECGVDGRIRLHLAPASNSFITVPLDPVEPGSIFYIGLLPLFLDQPGGLYLVRDNAKQLEPKEVFDNDDLAWASLIVNGLETWLNSPNLPGPVTPTAIHEAGFPHPDLDQAASLVRFDWLDFILAVVISWLGPLSHKALTSSEPILLDLVAPAIPPGGATLDAGSKTTPKRPRSGYRTPHSPLPDSPLPVLSPTSSDSSGSESSFASDMSHVYSSLFSDLNLGDGRPAPTGALDTPVTPLIPNLDKYVLWKKADIDKSIGWLTEQRKLRGSNRSPVELKCPRCNHAGRRPCELRMNQRQLA